MSDALSIFAAAAEAPDRIALRLPGRELSFAELAQLTRARLAALVLPAAGRPLAVDAANTLETLVTIYALLEARVPALMLHPRLTAAERGALLARAAAISQPLPADAAAILFTSGTTGTPRGAVITRANLLASAQTSRANIGWADDDCWQLAMPVARVGGLSILTRCLAARRAVAIPAGFDAATWPQSLAEQRVTLASLVPTMLTKVLDANPGWRAPASLRALLVGGDAASPRLLERARAAGLPIITTYGMTEACSHVVATPYAERYGRIEGAGRPLAAVEARIERGRIQLRGPMLMHGYWGEPPRDDAAWFDTGDIGEFDAAGRLHVYARRSDLIVSGGDNVYPAELELALEAAPGVAAVTVIGLPDETWGRIVAALVVPRAAGCDLDALAAWIAERLAPHKRPRRIALVRELPLTAAGKPDRSEAAARGREWQALRYSALNPTRREGDEDRAAAWCSQGRASEPPEAHQGAGLTPHSPDRSRAGSA